MQPHGQEGIVVGHGVWFQRTPEASRHSREVRGSRILGHQLTGFTVNSLPEKQGIQLSTDRRTSRSIAPSPVHKTLCEQGKSERAPIVSQSDLGK